MNEKSAGTSRCGVLSKAAGVHVAVASEIGRDRRTLCSALVRVCPRLTLYEVCRWPFTLKDNFVGTELNVGVEYARVAEACGLRGVKVETTSQLEEAIVSAIEGQMRRNETTLIEVVLNQELGEPFRRDAMTAPVNIAKISEADMRA